MSWIVSGLELGVPLLREMPNLVATGRGNNWSTRYDRADVGRLILTDVVGKFAKRSIDYIN